jgi:RNA polymerase sigma factor (sigma-70 family)
MPTERRTSALGRFRQALLVRECGGLGDGELLGRFLADRDEAAFAALVRRHGPMVLGVCRQVLGHAQDAEDAFQATFLVLLRRAAAIRKRESVGNWLYGVAYRTALEARAAAARRHASERQVRTMPEPTVEPAELPDDLRPVLDAELSRLPDRYRAAIVLCDLEGRPRREAALQLGIPEGTLSSRLAAGRRLLGRRLLRRGISLSAGALAAGLGAPAARAAVSGQLVQATVGSALAFTAGVTPAAVLTLSERVVRAMLLTRVKHALVLVLALTVLGTGAGVLWTGATGREPTLAAQEDGRDRGAAGRPEPGADRRPQPSGEAKDVWTLEFHFKDPRVLAVDVPGQGKKVVWYLRYDVGNNTAEPHTFIPDLELVTTDTHTSRRDHVLPKVRDAIRQLEDPTDSLRLKDSVTVAAEPILPSWPGDASRRVNGVAVWDGVDAQTTGFSLFVGGLTNVWSVTDLVDPETAKPLVRRKTLQLNFTRVGDRMEFVPPAQWVYRIMPLQPAPGADRRKGEGEKPDAEPEEAAKRIQELEKRLAAAEQERDELRKQAATLRDRLEPGKEKTDPAPAVGEPGKTETRREVLKGVQRQVAELKAKERDRRIYLEFLMRRVRSLRPPAGAEESSDIEAERRRERFRAMKQVLDHQVEDGDEEETNRDLDLDTLWSRLLTLRDLPPSRGEPLTRGEPLEVADQIDALLAAAEAARKEWKKGREEVRKELEELRRDLGERPGGR